MGSSQAAYYKGYRDSNLKHLSISFSIDVLAFALKDKREAKHHDDKAQEGGFCGFEDDYIHDVSLYNPDTKERLVTNKI